MLKYSLVGMTKKLKENYSNRQRILKQNRGIAKLIPSRAGIMTTGEIPVMNSYNLNTNIDLDSFQQEENYCDKNKHDKLFYCFYILTIILWGLALYLLLVNWKKLSIYQKILGFIGIFPIIPFGYILTFFAIFIYKCPIKEEPVSFGFPEYGL